MLEERIKRLLVEGSVLTALFWGCATTKIPTKIVGPTGSINLTGLNCDSACREKGYDYGSDSGKEFYSGGGIYEQKCNCHNHSASGSPTYTSKDYSGGVDKSWGNQDKDYGGHWEKPHCP